MKKITFFLTFLILTTSCTQWQSFFNSMPKVEPKSEVKEVKEVKEVTPEIIPPKEPDDVIFKQKPPPDNDIIYPLYDRGVVVDCESHIKDIKNILGKPKTVKVKESPNPHFPSHIDEKHTLFYNGLNIVVYVFENKKLMDETSIILGFTLTGQQYYLSHNIKIDSPFNQVKKQIKPLQAKKNYFLYKNIFEEGYEETIRFYFTQEKLSKVVWYCAIN